MIEKDGNVICQRRPVKQRIWFKRSLRLWCNRIGRNSKRIIIKTLLGVSLCDEEYSLIGFGNGLTRGYSNELISRHMNNNMQGVWLSLFKDIKPQNKIFEFTKNILIHNIDHTNIS
ncbi:ORFIN.2 [Ostreid herpesvirus 1]|nr:ORFIN.2 [Ostreid herpesvirus 1]ASK05699.1 ORFIN.2 [Ostreid herpesvirus 1]